MIALDAIAERAAELLTPKAIRAAVERDRKLFEQGTVAMSEEKPDWKDALDWVTCRAQDEDGSWFGYASKPTWGGRLWISSTGPVMRLSPSGTTNPNWKGTLEMRPDTTQPISERSDGSMAEEVSIRRQLLLDAADTIDGDRNETYGGPEQSFAKIADFWNTYLGWSDMITPQDVAAMLALLKIARISGSAGAHKDSWLDLAGYAACGWECVGIDQPKVDVEADNVKEKYNELLYAVAQKFPNETCHETALRYIKQAESQSNVPEANNAQQARELL